MLALHWEDWAIAKLVNGSCGEVGSEGELRGGRMDGSEEVAERRRSLRRGGFGLRREG